VTVVDWVTFAYIFSLAFGLIFAFVSGFLGDILGHGGETGGADGGVDVHMDGVEVHADGFDVHTDGLDVHPEAGVAAHMSPVSPPIISTLLTAFGGIGLICTKAFSLPVWVSLPVSMLTALVLATVVFFALGKLLASIQSTSHTSLASVVGAEAQVITPIPPDGVGEVAYSHGGVHETRPARSEHRVVIPKYSLVRITRVAGSTLIVREMVEERLRRLEEDEEPPAPSPAKAPEAPPAHSEGSEPTS
jgi:membrane protein implicated in regulation of membrane protease activity